MSYDTPNIDQYFFDAIDSMRNNLNDVLNRAVLLDGSQAMNADLDMGGYSLTNVNQVDGVDVDNHASRHESGGNDEITQHANNVNFDDDNVPYSAPETQSALESIIASNVPFDNTNFPSLASSYVADDVAGALNALGDSSGVVDYNLDVTDPADGYYMRWENGLQICLHIATADYSGTAYRVDYNWSFPVNFTKVFAHSTEFNRGQVVYSGINTDLHPTHNALDTSSVSMYVERISVATDWQSGDEAKILGITLGAWK